MPTSDELADAFRTMCRYSMTVIVDAESREATAVFYGGKLAKEPCRDAKDSLAAACRAIARCAAMAEQMLANEPATPSLLPVESESGERKQEQEKP